MHRSTFAEYGHKILRYTLPRDGLVQYAHWLHPAMASAPPRIDQSLIDGLREFISPGDFVIDIGAHGGDTTVPMALAAGAEGCTLALEPNRYAYRALAVNARLNLEKTNITALCYAATDADGPLVFNYGDVSFCNGGQQRKLWWRFYRPRYSLAVEGRNLKRLLEKDFAEWLPKLSYVKVDTEGSDLAILRSITPILRDCQPVICAEMFAKHSANRRGKLFDFLEAMGYQVYRYREGNSLLGPALNRSELGLEKHLDVLAVARSRQAANAA